MATQTVVLTLEHDSTRERRDIKFFVHLDSNLDRIETSALMPTYSQSADTVRIYYQRAR